MGKHHLRLPSALERVDKSGIMVVRTCHVRFRMAANDIHHSARKSTSCMCHMALQWLPITGFGMIGDDLRILKLIASKVELG